MAFPDGHYYSPVPSEDDLARAEAWRLSPTFLTPRGIEMDLEAQWERLGDAGASAAKAGFGPDGGSGGRYLPASHSIFNVADAAALAGMIVLQRPDRIIEIGSGSSTAVMLDVTDELSLDVAITSIEPFPTRLQPFLESSSRLTLVEDAVQSVPLDTFSMLESGDFLFIDSTHVGKAGSDVLYELFEILPSLRPGVFVHIHDMFPGFEYPKYWFAEGRYWNELYLVRAFLQFNSDFEIYLWPGHLGTTDKARYRETFLASGLMGGSLWLRRRDA